MARIIPVLDVMGGQVVRAVGGRRSEYRPLVSKLTDSTEPVEVARKLLDVTGAKELYTADLDEITNPGTETGLTGRLCDAFPQTRILSDQGLRKPTDTFRVPTRRPGWWQRRRKNLVPVVGTETVSDSATLTAIYQECGFDLVLSIDLFEGRWLGDRQVWRDYSPFAPLRPDADVVEVAESLSSGVINLLFLDLSRVGGDGGTGCEDFVRRTQQHKRSMTREVYAGGGVRTRDDVNRLADAGADAVLIASALHDGALM